jgi:ribosome maturation factor RimP
MEDGQRVLTGTLQNYQDSTITLHLDGGEDISLAHKDTSSVRLVEDDLFGGIEE